MTRSTRSQNALLSAIQPTAQPAELREVLLGLRHAGSLASDFEDNGVRAICALVDTVSNRQQDGHAACQKLALLLEAAPQVLTKRATDGRVFFTALQYLLGTCSPAAPAAGNLALLCIDALAELGAGADQVATNHRFTPLFLAVARGWPLPLVERLLELGANPRAKCFGRGINAAVLGDGPQAWRHGVSALGPLTPYDVAPPPVRVLMGQHQEGETDVTELPSEPDPASHPDGAAQQQQQGPTSAAAVATAVAAAAHQAAQPGPAVPGGAAAVAASQTAAGPAAGGAAASGPSSGTLAAVLHRLGLQQHGAALAVQALTAETVALVDVGTLAQHCHIPLGHAALIRQAVLQQVLP
ncbi:hypothetical protein ABPG75_004042 [Micractinium tetrahymenae]